MLKKLFIYKTQNSLIQLLRSIIVGIFSTVIDILLLAFFVEILNINVSLSTILAFIIGITVNYILNSFWVFSANNINSRLKEIIGFFVISAIGLVLNIVIITFFDNHLSKFNIFGNFISPDKYYLVGKIIVASIVFFWNFFARKIFIYKSGFLKN